MASKQRRTKKQRHAACSIVSEYEVIWGHIDILVVAIRRLSRRRKVKTLLAGPSPTSPMKRRLPTPLFPTYRLTTDDCPKMATRRPFQVGNRGDGNLRLHRADRAGAR